MIPIWANCHHDKAIEGSEALPIKNAPKPQVAIAILKSTQIKLDLFLPVLSIIPTKTQLVSIIRAPDIENTCPILPL